MPPGGKLKISFQVVLSPGVSADEEILNTAGVSGDNVDPDLSCFVGDRHSESTTDPFDPGPWCTNDTVITSLPGNDLIAVKWDRGDESLGWYNVGSKQIVAVGDPTCSRKLHGTDYFTKYPCAALVKPGQAIDYLIELINNGTNDLHEAVITDGLPILGDTGVFLTGDQRGTEWKGYGADPAESGRPVMLTQVVNEEGLPGITQEYTDFEFPNPPGSFCNLEVLTPHRRAHRALGRQHSARPTTVSRQRWISSGRATPSSPVGQLPSPTR